MNSRVLGKLCSLALLTLVLCAIPVSAQVPTGSINGVVKDNQNLPVSGASVTITDVGTGAAHTTITASNGGYEITHLNSGVYKVEVSAKGFKTSVVDSLKLDAATTLSVPPIVLDLGAVTETVTVEAGAELLQTDSAQVDDTVTPDQISKLPILNRNALSLLSIVPGVNNGGAMNNSNTNTTIDGQRTSSSSLTLDGINIQDNFIRANGLDFTPNGPFQSQTGEFTVNSQNGNPALGGGSSQVSIVTPRGTNDWHGQGFWYYRSNQWAANDWFANALGNPRIFLNQNQGGGNVGGPVFKDKLFVYGYYEFLSADQTFRQTQTILTPNARNGILTYVPTNSTTGNPITVNLLTLENTNGNPNRPTPPPFTIDPAVAALLARVPTTANDPNTGDGENTTGFDFNARNNTRFRNAGTRVDYDLNSHNSFSGVYSWNQQIFDRPDIDSTFNVVPLVSNNDKVNFLSTVWRWNPNSTLTNEVRFGLDFAPANFDTAQKFGSNFIDGGTTIFTSPDPNFPFQGRSTHTWSWQDNANWLHGNHNLGFGAQIQRISVQSVGDPGPTDLGLGFSIGNPYALTSNDFSQPISSQDLATANNLLSTLAGFVASESATFNVTTRTSGFVSGAPAIRNLSLNDWSLYAGDSWRMRPNFTVTYGLRWEYLSPYDEKNGLLLTPIVPAGQNVRQVLLSDATLGFAGGNSGRPVYNKDLNNFAPNIGIAWDPWGTGKTSIRAGYSVHFVNDEGIRAPDNAAGANPGLSSTPTNSNVVSTVSGQLTAPGIAPLPSIPAPAFIPNPTFSQNAAALGLANAVGFAVDPNLKTPYVQDWNLSIQRNVGWNTTVTVSYLGNHGASLYRGLDLNQVIIGSNGFLADFNRARSNAFLEQAAGNGFDPQCTNPVPGCQTLTVFPTLPGGGFLNNGQVQSLIRSGQVGTLADTYHVDGIEAFNGQFAPNEFIRGGDLLTNFSNSTYNAGLVEIQRRFKNGLNLQASYVYSKVLTDSSGEGQTKFDPLLDNANPKIERSRADFDLTHAFKANFFYDLPFGSGERFSFSNGILNRLVGGWTVSSIFTWQSGEPFSIFSARGTVNRTSRSTHETVDSALSISQIRNALGTSFGANPGQVFIINPAFVASNGRGVPSDALTCTPLANGFCNPAAGTLGTLGRNAFNGPAFFDEDLSVIKSIKITERTRIEVRADAFNVLNHPVFFVPSQNVNSTRFGVINSTASTPRILQIGAKFAF